MAKMGRPKLETSKSEQIRFRCTADFKNMVQERVTQLGFTSMSEYIEYLVNDDCGLIYDVNNDPEELKKYLDD